MLYSSCPCSFKFLGASYTALSACTNGYIIPGTSTLCTFSDMPTAMTAASSRSPRIAALWADLVADGQMTQPTCSPGISGQQSQLTWGISNSGSDQVDGLVRTSVSIAGASMFTSSAFAVVTWQNVRFYPVSSPTCERYTFQLILAVSSTSSTTYVVMQYTRVPASDAPAQAMAGIRGTSGARSIWSSLSNGASMLASTLGSGSNVGVPGLRVYRVDGSTVLPADAPPPPPSGS